MKRDGIEKLIKWLDTTDFYTAPASTRFHGNYPGGLVEHSLDVLDEMNVLRKAYHDHLNLSFSDDSIKIVALLHDVCKADMYGVEKRNRKNAQGQWEQYDFYTRNELFNFGGHGSKSVWLVSKHIQLTDEEAVAINCHMGSWDGNTSVGDAYEQFPLAWLLHVADEASTYLLER